MTDLLQEAKSRGQYWNWSTRVDNDHVVTSGSAIARALSLEVGGKIDVMGEGTAVE